jgi:hypothetical protein
MYRVELLHVLAKELKRPHTLRAFLDVPQDAMQWDRPPQVEIAATSP